jgi:hypothetical protein
LTNVLNYWGCVTPPPTSPPCSDVPDDDEKAWDNDEDLNWTEEASGLYQRPHHDYRHLKTSQRLTKKFNQLRECNFLQHSIKDAKRLNIAVLASSHKTADTLFITWISRVLT